jgi:integrase
MSPRGFAVHARYGQVVNRKLAPLLRKLGLPTKGVGLHAFRHRLLTRLADDKVSPATAQQIAQHTDVKTTLRYYYTHSDMERQRTTLAAASIGTNVPIGTTQTA